MAKRDPRKCPCGEWLHNAVITYHVTREHKHRSLQSLKHLKDCRWVFKHVSEWAGKLLTREDWPIRLGLPPDRPYKHSGQQRFPFWRGSEIRPYNVMLRTEARDRYWGQRG